MTRAVGGSRARSPAEVAALVAAPRGPVGPTRIEVTREGTSEAGRRLLGEGGHPPLEFQVDPSRVLFTVKIAP